MPPKGIIVRASTDMVATSDPLVAKALALVAENLSRPWGVAQLCAALCVAPRKLCRHFTAELGRSPGEEILRQRMAKARKLLGDTNHPLHEIASQCGPRGAAGEDGCSLSDILYDNIGQRFFHRV
jgi:LacI family transcriptional regulator